MTLVATVKRWFLPVRPPLPDAIIEAAALHEEAVAQQKAYWRGFDDGKRQATTAFLLTGNAVGRLRD